MADDRKSYIWFQEIHKLTEEIACSGGKKNWSNIKIQFKSLTIQAQVGPKDLKLRYPSIRRLKIIFFRPLFLLLLFLFVIYNYW